MAGPHKDCSRAKPFLKFCFLLVVFLLFSLGIDAATPPIQFGSPAHYNLGTNINGICTGDFNEDNRLDLATFSANQGSRVTIWTNNGSGVFQIRTNHLLTAWPQVMACGDISNDGHVDLVTINYTGDSISAFLGNGNGAFTRVDTATTVNYSFPGLALGDFNGDGKLDVAMNTYGVTIFFGNGSGSFMKLTNYNTGSGYNVAAARLNNDTNLDLVTGNYSSSSMSVYLGLGNGTFATPTNYSGDFSEYHNAVVAADFNGDGKLDLATGNQYGSSVSVRLNNGDGTFGPETKYSTRSVTYSVETGDFNGDGNIDIIASTGNSATNLVILPGNGNGTFGAIATNFPGTTLFSSQAIAVGDFDGDGRPDLASICSSNNALTIRLNQSTPVLQSVRLTNQFKLAWPNWNSFGLEASTNLNVTNGWTPVTNTTTIVGGQKVLTNSFLGENRFYRLRKTP